MATKFTTLLKFQIKYKFGISKIKDTFLRSSAAKFSAVAAALLLTFVVSAVLIPYGIVMSVIYDFFAQSGNMLGYFNTVTIMANVIVFITSILSVYNIMFAEKDWEILSPLPIKSSHIFLINYIILYFSSIISSCAFLLPGFVVYFIKTGFSFVILLKMLLGVFAFPALPLSLAFVIISLVMRFASKFRYKELLATIGGVLIIVVCLFINNNNDILNKLIIQADELSSFNKFLINSYMYTKSLSLAGMSSLFFALGSVFLAAVIVIVVYIFGGKVYGTIAESMLSVSAGKGKSNLHFIQKKQYDAFCRKEFKTILRSPIYALNCLINIVIAPCAVYMLWKQKTTLEVLFKGDINLFIMGLIPCFAIMAMSMVSSTSISREGKSFWITQIVPVSIKKQIKGRVKAAVIFYWICAFLYIFLFGMLLKTEILYIIYGLMVTFAGAVPFAYSGLIIDMNKPKLLWDKEAEAVKQNFNAVIGILTGFVFVIIYSIPIALYVAGVLSVTITMLLIPVIIIICIIITKYLLNKKGDFYEN